MPSARTISEIITNKKFQSKTKPKTTHTANAHCTFSEIITNKKCLSKAKLKTTFMLLFVVGATVQTTN